MFYFVFYHTSVGGKEMGGWGGAIVGLSPRFFPVVRGWVIRRG